MTTSTYIPLGTTTLSSATKSVTFSNIDQNYGDLMIVVVGTVETANATFMIPNGDTSSLSYLRMYGTGSAVAMSESRLGMDDSDSSLIWEWFDYSATDKHKNFLVRADSPDNQVGYLGGKWANSSAITSLEIYHNVDNFKAGTKFSVWGIAK